MKKAVTLLHIHPRGMGAAPVKGAPRSEEQAFQGISWACRLAAKP